VDELYFIAEKTREDLKSLRAQIKSDIIKKQSNYTEILPDFSVSYQDGFAGTRRTGLRENMSLMFNASISLGKNMTAGTITQIKADGEYVKSQQMKLMKKEQEIKTAILTSYLAKDNALKSFEASAKELEAAQESLNLAIGSYKAGQIAFTEVLDAQSVKSQAKLNVVRSIAEYNKAQIQLLFESGMISYSKVLKDYSPAFYTIN
jgi:outer membrane protein TolC